MANFTSSACRHDEHDLCQLHGKIRLSQGKTVRCVCSCHPAKVHRAPRRRYDDDED